MTGGMTVIDVKRPDPDGQFRLRGCRCGCEDVAYLQISAGGRKPWAVQCSGCGAVTEPFAVRHDAQICWNTNMAARPKKG